jgi:hypothetical protein
MSVVVEEQRFGAALAFIVAGAWADRIDVAPIGLGLRMDARVAVHLRCGRLEDAALEPLGQAQHVDGAVHAGLGGLHRVVLVVDRRSRAGEVVDFVDLDIERKRHIVAQQLETRVAEQMADVLLAAREEVVDADDIVPVGQEAITQVRAEKTGAAGDQHSSTVYSQQTLAAA